MATKQITEPGKAMPLAEVQADLEALVDFVTENPDETVVIKRSGRKQRRAVLVDEARFASLREIERERRTIRKQEKPFRLAGSLKSSLSADDLGKLIDENRKRQAELFRAKLDRILAED